MGWREFLLDVSSGMPVVGQSTTIESPSAEQEMKPLNTEQVIHLLKTNNSLNNPKENYHQIFLTTIKPYAQDFLSTKPNDDQLSAIAGFAIDDYLLEKQTQNKPVMRREDLGDGEDFGSFLAALETNLPRILQGFSKDNRMVDKITAQRRKSLQEMGR